MNGFWWNFLERWGGPRNNQLEPGWLPGFGYNPGPGTVKGLFIFNIFFIYCRDSYRQPIRIIISQE